MQLKSHLLQLWSSSSILIDSVLAVGDAKLIDGVLLYSVTAWSCTPFLLLICGFDLILDELMRLVTLQQWSKDSCSAFALFYLRKLGCLARQFAPYICSAFCDYKTATVVIQPSHFYNRNGYFSQWTTIVHCQNIPSKTYSLWKLEQPTVIL